MSTELLATLVEVASVIATGGRVTMKEPIRLPRPGHMVPPPAAEAAAPEVGEVDPSWTKAFLARRRAAAWGNTAEADVAGGAS